MSSVKSKGPAEEKNVLEELLGSPDDDDFASDVDRHHNKSKTVITPPKRISATVSKTKKFEDALNKIKEKKAMMASNEPQVKKPAIQISKISGLPAGGPSKEIAQESRPESPDSSSTTSSCSCEDHGSPDHGGHVKSKTPSKSPQVIAKMPRRSPPPSPREHHRPPPPRNFHKRQRSPSPRRSPRRFHDERWSDERDRRYEVPRPEKRRRSSDHERQAHHDHSRRLEVPERASSSKRKDPANLIRYFLKDCVYFVMKSNNYENVDLSMSQGVWSTPPQNEAKLDRAFGQFKNVILIFSVKESGKFQGFARLSSAAIRDHPPVDWILPPGLKKSFDTVFYLDWICRLELPFIETGHLFNPLNEGKPVKIARDGQEIDPLVGEQLIRLFPIDDAIDMIPLLKRMKKQTRDRPKKSSHGSHDLPPLHRHRGSHKSVHDRLTLPNDSRQLQVVIRPNSNQRHFVSEGHHESRRGAY